AQIEEHAGGSLRTQVANFGVTEGQFLMAIALVITAIAGNDIWSIQILPNLKAADVMLISSCFFPVLLASRSALEASSKGGIRILSKAAPIMVLEGLLVNGVVNKGLFAEAFSACPILVLTTFGVLFTRLTSELILASMLKIEYSSLDHFVLYPLPLLVLCLRSDVSAEIQFTTLGCYSVLVFLEYSTFIVKMSNAIARHLNIWVLRLGARNPTLPSVVHVVLFDLNPKTYSSEIHAKAVKAS